MINVKIYLKEYINYNNINKFDLLIYLIKYVVDKLIFIKIKNKRI